MEMKIYEIYYIQDTLATHLTKTDWAKQSKKANRDNFIEYVIFSSSSSWIVCVAFADIGLDAEVGW